MEEWVDVLDQDGRYTGETILKSEAHRQGIFHPTVHIWFYTSQGEILLQLRSPVKKTFPGFWDVSVAGHIGAGEPVEEAALREIREELGLSVGKKDLSPVGVFKSIKRHDNGIIDCEYHHTFLCQFNHTLSALEIQEEEVSEIRLFPMEILGQPYITDKTKVKIVPHDGSYYRVVCDAIRKHLKS
ncbi:NUDIX domain-containing protein [Muriicola sp.]|uniref:NUDIX hydrolase n=1 Tax=Muriicola sp. TaxID=2020856 RepID=UPI00356608AC